MNDKNNELIVVTKSIFDKIRAFFRNIFSKKKDTYKPSSDKKAEIKVDVETIIEEKGNNEKIEDIKEIERKKFFKKYNDYKAGVIKSSNFSGSEKVKLSKMLDEELSISKDRLERVIDDYEL